MHPEEACLWQRGLLPASWTAVDPAPEQADQYDLGPIEARAWHGTSQAPILAGGDASGGAASSDKRLRRVGWAFVIADPRGPQIAAGRMGGLDGRKQTVNRGS